MNHEILRKAIERFGEQHQVELAIEEFAELIQALNKVRRSGLLKSSVQKTEYTQQELDALLSLYSEIADVRIMLEQLTMIFDSYPNAVEQFIEEKIERMADRYDL